MTGSLINRLVRLETVQATVIDGRSDHHVEEMTRQIESAVRNVLGDNYMDSFKPNPRLADTSIPLEVRLASLLAG